MQHQQECKTKKKMKLLRQPDNSKTCGHHCVAMITGLSVEKVVNLIGHKRGTSIKELAKIINGNGFICNDKMIRFRQFIDKIPSLCILKLHFTNAKHTHWVVYKNGIIYDPAHECPYAYLLEHQEVMNQRATSYTQIKKR